MKRDWKYLMYLGIVFGLFLVVRLTSPRQFNWTVTYANEDKDPYGTYGLTQLLPSVVGNGRISHSYKTLYELKDSVKSDDNVFVISTNFLAGGEDVDALLSHVSGGGTAFVS